MGIRRGCLILSEQTIRDRIAQLESDKKRCTKFTNNNRGQEREYLDYVSQLTALRWVLGEQ